MKTSWEIFCQCEQPAPRTLKSHVFNKSIRNCSDCGRNIDVAVKTKEAASTVILQELDWTISQYIAPIHQKAFKRRLEKVVKKHFR